MVFRLLFPLLSPKSKDGLSPQTSRGLMALIMRLRDKRNKSQESLGVDKERGIKGISENELKGEGNPSKSLVAESKSKHSRSTNSNQSKTADYRTAIADAQRSSSPSISVQSSNDHMFVDSIQNPREPTPEPALAGSGAENSNSKMRYFENEDVQAGSHAGASNTPFVLESYSVDTPDESINRLFTGSVNSTVFSEGNGSAPTGSTDGKPDNKPSNTFSPSTNSPLGMQILKAALDDQESDSDNFHSASEKHDKEVKNRVAKHDSSSLSPPALEYSNQATPSSAIGKKSKKHSSLSLRRFFDKVKNHHHHHHSHHGAGAEKRPNSPVGEDSALYQKYGAIGKHLGTGASGSVNLITLPKTNQIYAVKKFASKLPGESDNDFKARVKNEFLIGELLKHPNLIHTYDLIKDYPSSPSQHQQHHHKHGVAKLISEPQFYMIMEYCPYDFFNLVMSGLIETEELLCYFKQIVNGVNYMHEQGLAHRDLKLDNCVVRADGVLKLIDYGSAVHFRKEINASIHINAGVDEVIDDKWKLVRARGVVGSDPYLAPEVLEPLNFGYDPRSADVWSCAVIFCCMVLRRFPWKLPKLSDPLYRSFVGISDEEAKEIEHNPIGITVDHNYNREGKSPAPQSGSPRGPNRLLRHLPLASRDLIGNMLKVDPKRRFLSAAVVEDPFFKSILACEPNNPATNHTHHLVTEEELERIHKEEQREKGMKKSGMH